MGEAVNLPTRALVEPPDESRRPDSEDPRVVVRGDPNVDGYEGEGGWTVPRYPEKYDIVMRQWRKQNPRYEHKNSEPKNLQAESETGEH